jgi:uncharacterized repeat protein (TIGR03803 family)
MNIAKALIGRASCVLAVLALGFGAGGACGQTDGATAAGVNLKTLLSFNRSDGVGGGTLIQATNGDFYGTTFFGGANANAIEPNGGGTIFKITPNGTLTTLYDFCAETNCADGANPGALIQATDGILYGTTTAISFGTSAPSVTIFKITPSGAFTTLYSFCVPAQSGCPNPQWPSDLIQAADGALYGSTYFGGAHNGGSIFKITTSGILTTIYNFCSDIGCRDGVNPSGGLVQATNGYLYGTTVSGGANGLGTIFKISPGGNLTTLYDFSCGGCLSSLNPSGLVQAPDGNLYGTTYYGGNTNTNAPYGGGTVFKITPGGAFTALYSFCNQSGCPDGQQPQALVHASDGSLYGTTRNGANISPPGTAGNGTIFKISPAGTFSTVYSFCPQIQNGFCADGFSGGGLIQSTLGIFYGTTGGGGSDWEGTLFALSTGAPPFVETRPAIGIAGEVVTIIGYGLKDATSVTFNGTRATILYDAPTVIYAKVPTGATTGKVQVVTPKGTLTSNVAFVVAP